MKLGHFVTNPGTRDPTVLASAYATLHDISDGRMVMGIGRGDSARRVIGQQPVKVAEFEAACAMIRDFMNGREVELERQGAAAQVGATRAPEIPLYVAGYGPKALAVAGRVSRRRDHPARRPGDHRVDHGHRARGRREGGPRPGRARVHRRRAVEGLRRHRRRARRGALVPGDGLEPRHGPDRALRLGLRHPVRADRLRKARKCYDYKDHSRVGAAHGEFVTDEICDRFCVIGSAEQCAAKLRELEAVGVDQFNVYLMTNGQEETLAGLRRATSFRRRSPAPPRPDLARLEDQGRRDDLSRRPLGSLGAMNSLTLQRPVVSATTSPAATAKARRPSTRSAASRSRSSPASWSP